MPHHCHIESTLSLCTDSYPSIVSCLGAELSAALSASKVDVSTTQVNRIIAGLQDNAGLVNYRTIAKELLNR